MPRPLTKLKLTGETYARGHEIDTEIDRALTQDLATLVARAAIRSRKATDYLRNEVLVHLIREALRCSDDRAMNQLVPILLKRVEAILCSKVPDSVPYAADIRAEVLGRLSDLIAEDAAGDQCRLDIYECQFGLPLRALQCDVVREFRKRRHDVSLDTDDREDDEDHATKHEPVADRDFEPGAIAIVKDMLADVEALPDKERKAFVLHHIHGFKIESEDPTHVTVATLCGVTGRTVRNLLTRAKAKLAAQRLKHS